MVDTAPDNNPTHARRKTDRARLDSWKAIANYLNRSARTVRRWESSEGLPVHRHRHTKGCSVYAFQTELDEWQAGHQETIREEPDGDSGFRQTILANQWGRYAAILVVTLLVGGVVDRFVNSPNAAVKKDVVTLRLAQLDDTAYWPESVARVLVAPVFAAWSDGRIQDAFRESRAVVQRLPVLPPGIQSHVTDYMVEFSLSIGRVSDARALMENLPSGELRNALDARISFASGDMTRLPEVLLAGSAREDPSPAQSDVFLGIAAMQAGHAAEAKNRFRAASDELDVEDRGYFFVALDMLAGITKAEGDISNAIRILEITMPARDAAAHNRSGLFWLMCQRQLANLYRETGRERDAEQIEDVLRGWLVLAEDTFPLALSLVDA